jgi:TetR/AcrR family tetracycline transcriptional repressor
VGRGLSKASIVRAALSLLDSGGLDALTVRAVAGRLEVKAPALYWHVRSKQDLIDEMATEIWRGIGTEITALPADLPWRQVMIAFATITRRTMLAHRDGAKVFAGSYLTDPAVATQRQAGLARMLSQGFTTDDVTRAYSLLYSFTIGFCIEEQAIDQAAAASPGRVAAGAGAASLALAAGPRTCADRDGRFDELVAMIVETTDRLRATPLGNAARVAAATAAAAAKQRRAAPAASNTAAAAAAAAALSSISHASGPGARAARSGASSR